MKRAYQPPAHEASRTASAGLTPGVTWTVSVPSVMGGGGNRPGLGGVATPISSVTGGGSSGRLSFPFMTVCHCRPASTWRRTQGFSQRSGVMEPDMSSLLRFAGGSTMTSARCVGIGGSRHPRHDLAHADRSPILASDADVQAGPGGRNAAVGMPVDMEGAVPGMGPRHVRVVAAPKRLRLGHAGVLDVDSLDVCDGAGPFEAVA